MAGTADIAARQVNLQSVRPLDSVVGTLHSNWLNSRSASSFARWSDVRPHLGQNHSRVAGFHTMLGCFIAPYLEVQVTVMPQAWAGGRNSIGWRANSAQQRRDQIWWTTALRCLAMTCARTCRLTPCNSQSCLSFGPNCLQGSLMTWCASAGLCTAMGLPGQCFPRGCVAAFALECTRNSAWSCRRRLLPTRSLPFAQVSLCLRSCPGRGFPFFGCCELHAGATCLWESNRDGLLGWPRTVFAFTNVMYLFSHKFTRLGARRLAFLLVLPGKP